MRVLAGACDALSTPRPLGPLLDVAAECDGLADAVRVGEQPAEVFAALRDELAEQPTVLVLEDLHWGDEATFDVLRLLARRMDVPALVVATYRDDGLDAVIRCACSWATSRPRVQSAGSSLGPLSPVAVARACGRARDRPGRPLRTTGGNPFFVAQVLAPGSRGAADGPRRRPRARVRALGRAALEVLEAVALALPRTEPWLLEGRRRRAARPSSTVRRDGAREPGTTTPSPSATSSRGPRSRMRCRRPAGSRVQRRILAALLDARDGEIDPARLAHHAEAARDVEAVLEFAPAAAARARRRRVPTARRRPSTPARSASAGTTLPPRRARSCSRADRGPATSPTTRSRRSR